MGLMGQSHPKDSKPLEYKLFIYLLRKEFECYVYIVTKILNLYNLILIIKQNKSLMIEQSLFWRSKFPLNSPFYRAWKLLFP